MYTSYLLHLNPGRALIVTWLIAWGCSQRSKTPESYDTTKEITTQLETVDQKREFLEDIHERDQKYRLLGQELLQTHGYGSEPVTTNTRQMMSQDLENLNLIKSYLELHGYPTLQDYGRTATYAPWLVLHHSTDTALRRRYFDLLQKAYLDGNIDESAFALYLERTWMLESGESGFEMKSPYRMSEKIERLIEALKLDTLGN